MIRLEVEPYCQNCQNFDAEVNKMYGDDTPVLTVISCVRSAHCARLVRYLEKKMVASDEHSYF